MIIQPYGAGIREAIASNDVEQMKAMAENTKKFIKENGDISTALVELLDKIDQLEKK
ncbi:DUF1843 domain-containing protein [Aureibacter tunicatorum]|uniref:DUF1843 domain-containing protein n=1 Tax=Aureibacter tunicatorum TaxID=866807 RepID=A0AAE3XSM5_9BACT|nr:DUF1843 domain-containing protein [Aureibacter tunicatorum]MDR6240829.1 hypothetical protein [Aureibacter tunicatorum]BDD06838.1 hypothetical protein AUTU_43210 [Aureibacter tunicatorum]